MLHGTCWCSMVVRAFIFSRLQCVDVNRKDPAFISETSGVAGLCIQVVTASLVNWLSVDHIFSIDN